MKTKLVNLSDFGGHPHPASILFRSIELKTIHENCKNIDFKHPSLDIGCGDGYMTSILFDDRFSFGVDNGEAKDVQVSIRNKRYKKVLIESAEKMSIKSNSMNFVFSNSVIEHIPDNEAVLSEISRTLRKNGIFIFTSPSHLFPKYLQRFPLIGKWYAKKRNQLLNHYHIYSHKEWASRLSKYGLRLKKYRYYITQECLTLWDNIALEVRLRKLFDKQAETHVYRKYEQQIKEYFYKDHVTNDRGASLFIYAVKT